MNNQNQNPVRVIGGFMEDLFNGNAPRIFRDDFFRDEWFKNQQQVPVNIRENQDDFVLEVAAPGFEKENFKIQVNDNVLQVSLEIQKDGNDEKQAGNSKVVRQEFMLRSFKRSFRLGQKVDTDKISAKYENGILFLNLPKKETMKTLNKIVEIA